MTLSLSPPLARATNDRPAMLFQLSTIVQLHMQHYRLSTATLNVYRYASQAHYVSSYPLRVATLRSTVAYILYMIKCRVKVTSVGLAQARPIIGPRKPIMPALMPIMLALCSQSTRAYYEINYAGILGACLYTYRVTAGM